MSRPVVLVTGSTGANGSQIVRYLSESGTVDIRAAVRDTKKATELSKLPNVTLVTIDGTNNEYLTTAFKGVNRFLLLTPFVENASAIGQSWLDAGKAAGAQFVLKFSALGALTSSPVEVLNDHGKQEDMVKSSGLDYAIIRPGYFQENLLSNAGSIKSNNTWYGASGTGKYAPIATQDISEAAAMILLDPNPHKGKTYTLTGPKLYTDNDIAEILSAELNRKVTYTDVPNDTLMKTLSSYGMPPHAVKSIIQIYSNTEPFMVNDIGGLQNMVHTGNAETLTDHVKQITGKNPKSMEEWIKENKGKFQ